VFGFYDFHARHGVEVAKVLIDQTRSGRGSYKPFLHGIARAGRPADRAAFAAAASAVPVGVEGQQARGQTQEAEGEPRRAAHDRHAYLASRATRDFPAERAGAFEAFHNSQHRYRATNGRAPDEIALAQRREPLSFNEIPAGWPAVGRIEFIRFIRSDHKLRLLGRAIQIPDGHAYQYLTATLDLAIEADHNNLLIYDQHGELVTTTRLHSPRR
jgi:hypothetical protein